MGAGSTRFSLLFALLVFNAFIGLQGCGNDGEAQDVTVPTDLIAATTGAPETATTGTTPLPPTVTVAGALEFSMDPAAAASVVEMFQDPEKKAEISSAFATSLATGLDGVEEDDVLIKNIA